MLVWTDSALCSNLALLDQAGALAHLLGRYSSIGGGIGGSNPNTVELLGQEKPIDSYGYLPCKQILYIKQFILSHAYLEALHGQSKVFRFVHTKPPEFASTN